MSTKHNSKLSQALSDSSLENKTVNAAYKLAEKQLMDGTATSQVITHFLKLGSIKSKIELEKLKLENKLLEAKIDAELSRQRVEEMYEEVLDAMKRYTVTND